jgi:hypothetical protein
MKYTPRYGIKMVRVSLYITPGALDEWKQQAATHLQKPLEDIGQRDLSRFMNEILQPEIQQLEQANQQP